MRNSRLLPSLAWFSALAWAANASAAPALRVQVDQRGDFALIGNAAGFECSPAAATPPPVVGAFTCPAAGVDDSSPDIFWRSQDPTNTTALANATITATTARTSALLALPAGATVTYARVYWAGFLQDAVAVDKTLRIERPLPSTLNQLVTADASHTVDRGAFYWYESTADVTALVAAAGPGLFRVSDIASVDLPGTLNNNDPIAAWSLLVFYRLDRDPPRNLALFDGLDLVATGAPARAALSGFVVPNAGFDAKLGVIAYEGENQLTGDSLLFNGTALSDAVNPVGNFFNSSRSRLGVPVSVAGDLPRLSGGPASMSGFDLDVVDVKAELKANDKSATIEATSTGDTYLLGAFITSIATFKPDFAASTKTLSDLNAGSILPGDELEYTVTVINQGNDASANTVMTDALPAGITYEPSSIRVTTGANVGPKTDGKDADQAEYDAATRTIRVRVGAGADGATGGTVAVAGSSEIRFRVTVDRSATGSIQNQAVVSGAGQLGAPPTIFPSDGNGAAPGAPPTTAEIDQCQANAQCQAPTPACNTALLPKVCVGCITDGDCPDPTAKQCNTAMHVCGCTTNCLDSDGDGIPDDVEIALGTDPHDADSDDDGVPDGQEPSAALDTDGDGLINALDPDSDNDGLFDGTELGKDCANPATDLSKGHCRPDADQGKTVTDPLLRDTDKGGASDGSEDFNLDGALELGESDPTAGHGSDDSSLSDQDGDGLSDGLEATLRSDPRDADSDDDGVRDGDEANPSDDTDGDGLNNVLDVDSDNDALFDGTESGKNCDDPATNAGLGHCIADADKGLTRTSPLLADTDHGGAEDGSEDFNRNGAVDPGETDATIGHASDDALVVDSDGDGLSDGTEASIGSDPHDADSDDDGVIDGAEPNPSDDSDGDGAIDALDPDSDNDGLFDGTEVGHDCKNPATRGASKTCIADRDSGATRTSPLEADTDHGSVNDGDEDANHDGVVGNNETDPNNPADDRRPNGNPGAQGGDEGALAGAAGQIGGVAAQSGGSNGRGGSAGLGTFGGSGESLALGGLDGGAGMGNAGGVNSGVLEGGGCACRAAPGSTGTLGGLSSALLSLALLAGRRRARGSRDGQ